MINVAFNYIKILIITFLSISESINIKLINSYSHLFLHISKKFLKLYKTCECTVVGVSQTLDCNNVNQPSFVSVKNPRCDGVDVRACADEQNNNNQ